MAWATSAEIRNDFLKEKNYDKIPDDLTYVIGVTIFAGKDKLFVVGIGRIFNLKTIQIPFFHCKNWSAKQSVSPLVGAIIFITAEY